MFTTDSGEILAVVQWAGKETRAEPESELRSRRLEVLVFEMAGQRYALWSAQVQEILRAMSTVPLPSAPAIVEGIVDVRGTFVPVLDMRARFRLPARPAAHTDHLILAWADHRLVALRADRALDLVRLDADDVGSAESIVYGANYVAGVAQLADGLVLIHDLRTFLSQAEAAALDQALLIDAGGSA
jgi:purine-binding chemotaxis protein CheW